MSHATLREVLEYLNEPDCAEAHKHSEILDMEVEFMTGSATLYSPCVILSTYIHEGRLMVDIGEANES